MLVQPQNLLIYKLTFPLPLRTLSEVSLWNLWRKNLTKNWKKIFLNAQRSSDISDLPSHLESVSISWGYNTGWQHYHIENFFLPYWKLFPVQTKMLQKTVIRQTLKALSTCSNQKTVSIELNEGGMNSWLGWKRVRWGGRDFRWI